MRQSALRLVSPAPRAVTPVPTAAAGDPLAGLVTRPNHFDPSEDYAAVVVRGDNPVGDYDFNDMQAILRYDLAQFGGLLVQEGAIILEAGGTFGVVQPGIIVGGDACVAAGAYIGTQSQVYTITVLTSGAGGTATYTWTSTGPDTPTYTSEPFPIPAVAPDAATGLANLAAYGCLVGAGGLVVVFVNPIGSVHGASSFVVQATYGAQPPVVVGTTITVSDVIVFVNGNVQRVKGGTLTYPPLSTGVSIVYGEWTRTLISEVDDPTLTDPLSNQAQAYRERWVMTLQTVDTSGQVLGPNVLERKVIALYQWDRATDLVTQVIPLPLRIDIGKTTGALEAARLVNVPQSTLLQGLLARRTYAAHGSFVAEPPTGTPRAYPSTNPPSGPGLVRLTLPPVYASIQGVEFQSTVPQDIEIDQATDTGTVLAEPHTFTTPTMLYTLNQALPSASAPQGYPISTILAVYGYVQVSAESVTRGNTALDALSKTPVVVVQDVKQGATTYVQGTDYTVSGNDIQWVAGHGPAAGQTYTVDYQYNKTMVPGTDYVLTGGAVDFSAPSGDQPVNGSVFQVNYSYFLWRTDGVAIRPTGEIIIIRGIPQLSAVLPVLPMYCLPYCTVAVAPGTSQVTVTAYNNDAMPMEELCALRDAVRQLLIDMARIELFAQAQAKTSANLLDVLSDAFADLTVADQNFNTGGITFNATIDTDAQLLTLPYTQIIAPLLPTAVPGGLTPAQATAAFWMLPYVHELAVDAPKWSTDYPVNPYADFRPEPPFLQLTPDRDFWVDTTNQSSTSSRIVENGRHKSWRIVGAFTTNYTQVVNVAALYMRQIPITLAADHLVPGEHLRVQIDGKDCPITANDPAMTQVDAYTVTATLAGPSTLGGSATIAVTIPGQVPSGTTTVALWGDQGVPGAPYPAGYTVRATALYTSVGIIRETTTESVVSLVQNDPVAQSFIFPSGRMFSQVVVPIAATPPLDPSSPPLICELRATDESGDASSPTSDVLATVSRDPWTWQANQTVVFPDPVYTPANTFRSVVLRSASNLYHIYVSQLGGPDRSAGGFITSQQIDSGIFMDSSNNDDWTLHQDWDLRCQLYVAAMTALTAYVYYAPVVAPNATAIFLTVDQVAPDACGITWQYSLDGSTWTAFDAFTLTPLPQVAGSVQIRAVLWSTDPYASPAIAQMNPSLLVQSNLPSGHYVSLAKQTSGAATEVGGQIDLALPVGATATMWVSTNNGGTWRQATLTPAGVAADGLTSYSWLVTGLTSLTPAQLRLRVDLAATNLAAPPVAKRLYSYAMP
jgi:hypothetical protein